jgi:hypothetical protein
MSNLWYKNLYILLENPFEQTHFNRIDTINSLARFGLYSFIIIIILKLNYKLLSISIITIIISLFLAITENFESNDKCTKPTIDNPFMNYTIGDLITTPDRPKACPYDKVKKNIKKNFTNNIYSDNSELWGKFISDRNFYTMPNTDIVNDQIGFALCFYGNDKKNLYNNKI